MYYVCRGFSYPSVVVFERDEEGERWEAGCRTTSYIENDDLFNFLPT